MARQLEGDLVVRDQRFGVVVSRFNDFITDRLLEGALGTIDRHGGDREKVTVVRVPGSFELPFAARKLAASGRVDAVICLGCVIRGGTSHYEHVVAGATQGVAEVARRAEVPVIFGIVTADTLEQAVERAGSKQGNSGADAARSAIEMANLDKAFGSV